ncbi:MAG: ribokinase [Clostridiales bacterium]|nr:ribokinase [Clostridiales bacterium]
MRVLNFGSLNIDHIYRVDHIVSPGETLAASSLSFAAGGKGLNQSIALAKSGMLTYHAGCIGSDGQSLEDILSQNGVKLNYLEKTDSVNGHAIIQVNAQGQNSIVIFGGSNRSITQEQVDRTLADFTPQDLVLMQNETSMVCYIAQRCKELHIPLAFNPSPISSELLDTFPFDAVSYLLVNETEAYDITKEKEPDRVAAFLLEKYPEMKLVMTLGGDGAYYADKNMALQQPAFHVEAVDTTGAGDTFTGFFLGLVMQGKDYQEALRYACAASAIAVTKQGAAPAIPTLDMVNDFLVK